jgi:hypothetical protein
VSLSELGWPNLLLRIKLPTGNEQGSAGMATVGSGAYTYEPVENSAKLPPGWSFKEIGGVGVDRHEPVRPTLEEIQRYLAGTPFAHWANLAERFATAETLEPKDHKTYLRTLLYPGRFCYSWMTGRMGSNDHAVAFLGKTRPRDST